MVLFLYLCASYQPVSELLKLNHYRQSIGPLIQLPSTEIKVLSKALIARLIPADVVSDDSAAMTLIENEEVDYLMGLIVPDLYQSYKALPVISIMMDLSRSPHNLFGLVSKDAVTKLSDVLESLSEEDEAKTAQLIWRMMELEYNGSEGLSAISHNGTLQMKSEGT